jgi:transcriptional repressor NrdR
MVCIYCDNVTRVTNSRLQKRINQVWRRRACIVCGNAFTTHERADLYTALVVRHTNKDVQPFSRDRLYISIYESCKHRPSPIDDVTGLTDTILGVLRGSITTGTLDRIVIIKTATEVLRRFDGTAAAVYAAFHKE